MARLALSLCAWRGIRRELTTRIPRLAAGSFLSLLTSLPDHSHAFYFSNYATMRFAPESLHGANNGLNIARAEMEKIKQEFPWITYGDLWTLGGVCALQVSSPRTHSSFIWMFPPSSTRSTRNTNPYCRGATLVSYFVPLLHEAKYPLTDLNVC